MEKILLNKKQNYRRILRNILNSEEQHSLVFLNNHDLYNLKKEEHYKKFATSSKNIYFIDGFAIALFLSLKNLSHIERFRGPSFTKEFLSNENLSGNKKHFFIGLEEKELDILNRKFTHLKRENLFTHNPPYIKELKFPEEEINKIAEKISSEKPDFVWVCIATPKQHILTYSLLEKTTAKLFFNVGAALDFLLGKKKEANSFFQKIGLEWFYRLVTDFKYSKKKVWRSFSSLPYIWRFVSLNEK